MGCYRKDAAARTLQARGDLLARAHELPRSASTRRSVEGAALLGGPDGPVQVEGAGREAQHEGVLGGGTEHVLSLEGPGAARS